MSEEVLSAGPGRGRVGPLAPVRVGAAVLMGLSLGLRVAREGGWGLLVGVVSSVVATMTVLLLALAAGRRRRVARIVRAHPDALAVAAVNLRLGGPPPQLVRGSARRSRVLPATAVLMRDRLRVEPAAERFRAAAVDLSFGALRAADWRTAPIGSRRIAVLELFSRYGGPDVLLRLDPVAPGVRKFGAAAQEELTRWLPVDGRPAAMPACLTGPRRTAWLAMAAALLVIVLGVCGGFAAGQALDVPMTGMSADRSIGLPGYYTFGGLDGRPLQGGAPWGVGCRPLVVRADASVPADAYQALAGVVLQARLGGLDITLARRDGSYDPAELYGPGPEVAAAQSVVVFADHGTATSGDAHDNIGWDTSLGADADHDYLSYLSEDLHLNVLGTDPIELRKAALRLVGRSQGIGVSSSAGSAFAARWDQAGDGFTPADLQAMLTMSGCASARRTTRQAG